MTSADSRSAHDGLRQSVPIFRQALLIGAATTRMPSLPVPPDKSMMFPCTSSSFTKSTIWERLRCLVAPRLTGPAGTDASGVGP